MHGYVDKDGDGWRDQPDGRALVLEYSTPARPAKPPAHRAVEQEHAGHRHQDRVQDRQVARKPEGQPRRQADDVGRGLERRRTRRRHLPGLGFGPNKGGANHARFNLPAFNVLYEKQREMPDGPERLAVMDEAKKLMVAYMPYKVHVHRIFTDLAHPWVQGYHRNIFVREFFKYVDLDPAENCARALAT
jgi:hypothetical protein